MPNTLLRDLIYEKAFRLFRVRVCEKEGRKSLEPPAICPRQTNPNYEKESARENRRAEKKSVTCSY